MRGIDCSARVDEERAEKIRANGYSFVGRYLVPASMAKAITPREAETLRRTGLGVLLVFELEAERARRGAAVGRADGSMVRGLAKTLGAPEGTVIYFAVDYDAPPGDLDAIEAYLRAAGGELGGYRPGVYGGYRVIEAMAERRACSGYWQCVAWSGGRVSRHLTVYQSEWQYGNEALAMAAKLGFYVDIDVCADMARAGIWEGKMSGEEIFRALQSYLAEQPVPDWAEKVLGEAVALGITDGTDGMQLTPRYQAAIMALRAYKAAVAEDTNANTHTSEHTCAL